jgi:peptidoglycan/xylan/chitin deacetylase (PgdA/CDA1 family)
VSRLSALGLIVCLVLAGCGIQVRTLPAPVVPPKPASFADPVAARPNPTLPPVNTAPLVLAPGQTVVTITFDDGRASNAYGAEMLTNHHLPGTFFINSGNIGKPGYLTMPQLDGIAAEGHEIGGHTVNHPDLVTDTTDEIARQICDDRETLLGWGFQVRNFAYPFSSASPDIEALAQRCGYNSARSLGELKTFHVPEGWDMSDPANSCAACTWSETVPPQDPMYTRAPAQVRSNWMLADLQRQVTNATEGDGSPTSGDGGWVQLTFHGICPSDCSDITTPAAEFDQFLSWLADQQAQGKLIVRTVGDVIGGPVAPPVSGPPPTAVVVNPSLEATQDDVPSCWMRAAYGNNKPEFSEVPTAHTGTVAERLVMRDYVDGDAKLIPTEDLGTCSIAVVPGQSYTIGAWYSSTVPTQFSVQYRITRGTWVYGTASPVFNPATAYTPASWTMPPIPDGVTAISFGLILQQNGELVTDDYSMTPGAPRP